MNTKLKELDPEIDKLIKDLDGTRHLGRGVLHASTIAIVKLAQMIQSEKIARYPRFISIYLPVLGYKEVAIVSVNLKNLGHLKSFEGAECRIDDEGIKIEGLLESFEMTLKNSSEGIGFVFTTQIAVFKTGPSATVKDFYECVVNPTFMEDQLKFPFGSDGKTISFHHSIQTVDGPLPDSALARPETATGKVIHQLFSKMAI